MGLVEARFFLKNGGVYLKVLHNVFTPTKVKLAALFSTALLADCEVRRKNFIHKSAKTKSFSLQQKKGIQYSIITEDVG